MFSGSLMGYIFSNQDPKLPQRMIIKQATRITKAFSSLLSKTTLLSKFNQSSFKLSKQLQTATYRDFIAKSSNLRFQDSNISLHPYYYHPSIEAKPSLEPRCYEIQDSPVLTLNFLDRTTEELAKQAWNNRKNVSLRFRDLIKLMKVEPLSKQTVTIKQKFQNGGIHEKVYTKQLIVADHSQKGEVEMFLRHFSTSQPTKQQDTLWEVKMDIKYEDYLVFLSSIKSNLLYISGAKFSLEITKEESIIELKNVVQKPPSNYKQTTKKSSEKGYKAKKTKF